MAGPNANKYESLSDEELFDLGVKTLSNLFSCSEDEVRKEVETWRVVNWSKDEYARGAYSYSAMGDGSAEEKLTEPIGNKIFFAGEALYSGEAIATVEGALGSGREVAKKILSFSL